MFYGSHAFVDIQHIISKCSTKLRESNKVVFSWYGTNCNYVTTKNGWNNHHGQRFSPKNAFQKEKLDILN
jgi:hypothetical protein